MLNHQQLNAVSAYMTKMDVTKLAAIPFLNHAELPGRFLCSSLFYDGEWHAWIEAGQQKGFENSGAAPAELLRFDFKTKPLSSQ